MKESDDEIIKIFAGIIGQTPGIRPKDLKNIKEEYLENALTQITGVWNSHNLSRKWSGLDICSANEPLYDGIDLLLKIIFSKEDEYDFIFFWLYKRVNPFQNPYKRDKDDTKIEYIKVMNINTGNEIEMDVPSQVFKFFRSKVWKDGDWEYDDPFAEDEELDDLQK